MLPMAAQSTMPTESFVFNLDLRVKPIGNEKLLQELETGNGATCKDLSVFLKALGVFDQAKTDGLTQGGYIIQMLRFKDTELSEKRHAWYTLDSAWLDENFNCTRGGGNPLLSAYRWAEDMRTLNHFRDLRLWGRTNLEMVTLLSFTVSENSIEQVFKTDENLAAVEAAIDAAMRQGKEMCDVADDTTKSVKSWMRGRAFPRRNRPLQYKN